MNAIKKIGSLLLMGLLCQLLWSCTDEFSDPSNESTAQPLSKESAYEINKVLQDFANRKPNQRIFQKFQNPPEVKSKDGRLIHDLNIEFVNSEFFDYLNLRKSSQPGNISLQHRSYNSGLTGATWRVKPGDSLYINLFNHLEEVARRSEVVCDEDSNLCYDLTYNSKLGKCAKTEQMHPHGDSNSINKIDPANFNNTNLHVHGLHVSPKGHSDNVFVNLKPGQRFQNRIHIREDHAQGSFWYHGHVHGSTAIQVSSGMAGALIIEGGLDDQKEIKEMKERIFMLQQMPYIIENGQAVIKYVADTTFGNKTWKQGKWRTTINGQVLPVISMQEAEVQRWRFFHAGIRESVNLKLVSKPKNNKLYREQLHVIAEDGIAYGRVDESDNMLLHPGYRADLLVQAPGEPDTLLLIDDVSKELGAISEIGDSVGTKADSSANKEPLKVLALVIVQKRAVGDKLVVTELPTSTDLAGYAPYDSLVNEITTTSDEMMTFDIDIKTKPEGFLIDGKAFAPHAAPRKLVLDAVQDWELSSKLGSHPFHIHVNHFQIIAKQKGKYVKVDGEKEWVPSGKFVPVKNPIWKDTYMVNGNEKTRIRTVYKDFTGQFVIHCHILLHEDQGMMQRVEIIDKSNDESQTSVLRNSVTGEPVAVCR